MRRAIYQHVADSAVRHPARVALHLNGQMLTYGELWGTAEKIASVLRWNGLGDVGATVALPAERTFATYAGILGILASGNAYLPIGASWPSMSARNVCSRAGIAAMISAPQSDGDLIDSLSCCFSYPSRQVVDCGTLGSVNLTIELEHTARAQIEKKYHGDYAYMMFTSGTTGPPKGIPVSHENVAACLDGVSSSFALIPEDRCAQMADLSFDVSVAEMFLCWRAGACLYIPTRAQTLNPGRFIADNRLTIWSSVPSVIRNLKNLGALPSRAISHVRIAVFCGETLPCALAYRWQDAARNSIIMNLYGPTEATIFATLGRWDGVDHPSGTVPIGWALEGVTTKVVRFEHGDEAGPALSELLLSGPQLVEGYWDDPVATDRAFVRDAAGTIWYKTGDLVGEDSKHGLYFRGRKDTQVKCRGYRVDTNEVSRVVREVTGSDLAVVVPVWNDDGLCESLVAFCDGKIAELDCKKRCAHELPDYMIPGRIVHLATFPMTANGKLDSQALSREARAMS